jgi:hypothetical protein
VIVWKKLARLIIALRKTRLPTRRQALIYLTIQTILQTYESRQLESDSIRTIFEDDLEGLKSADNFLLVLPAGNSSHIEAGISYGLGKKCYAIGEYEKTDSLYLIFEKIFADVSELEKYNW